MSTQYEQAKEKKWVLKSVESQESQFAIAKIAEALQIHPIIAKLLYNRGYTDENAAKSFILMESEMLANPFDMKDIDKGIERIHTAVKNKEKITVYGDYDVDGVTSVCTLYLYLKSYGANVSYYIPNRTGEGYGVSTSAIDMIKEDGTTLIITVDTGITANDEVLYAKERGIDFVITDHHECRSDIPKACAVINPHRPDCPYPFKELAGVGVVFKLISAYEEYVCKITRKEAALRIFTHYADLVAIGTIADVMPIKSENRIIVSYGLKMIENATRPGLLALINATTSKTDSQKADRVKKRVKITSGYVGYTLAPRINAAGRIKSASIAVELFLAQNAQSASQIADELCKANKERQAEENKIMVEAYEMIEAMDLQNDPVIVLNADNWHHGVIGIVSSRITEKYSRPSILVSFEGNDGIDDPNEAIGKGSGRSIKGMNLVDALCHCSDRLVKFGGHELAAGLSVKRCELDALRREINEYARQNLSKENMVPTIEADCVISFSDIKLSFAAQLQQLEPYGIGNPTPTFVLRGANICEISPISEGKHTRLVLGDGSQTITAMYFSNSPDSIDASVGDKVDILFNVDINEWLGKRSVQLIVKDLKASEGKNEAEESEKIRFKEIWSGAEFAEEENVIPTREEFASVYRFIYNSCRNGHTTFNPKEIISKITKLDPKTTLTYIKLKIIFKVFNELNLLGISEDECENYTFSLRLSQKTDLDKSNLLRRLRNQQRKI